MLRVLLAKDLRRAARNPLPWLINLLVPLCMTALIGLAFGTKSDSGALGRIRFAVEQWVAAAAPSNFLAFNAEAQKKAIETKGESIAKGVKKSGA